MLAGLASMPDHLGVEPDRQRAELTQRRISIGPVHRTIAGQGRLRHALELTVSARSVNSLHRYVQQRLAVSIGRLRCGLVIKFIRLGTISCSMNPTSATPLPRSDSSSPARVKIQDLITARFAKESRRTKLQVTQIFRFTSFPSMQSVRAETAFRPIS